MSTAQKTYYQILQVDKSASTEVIHSAYRALVKQYHPDHFHSSDKSVMTEQLQRINRAYEILSDPVLRKEYDHSLQDHPEASETSPLSSVAKIDLKKLLYWMIGTVLLLSVGRLALRVFLMLPFLLKILALVAIIYWVNRIIKLYKKPGGLAL